MFKSSITHSVLWRCTIKKHTQMGNSHHGNALAERVTRLINQELLGGGGATPPLLPTFFSSPYIFCVVIPFCFLLSFFLFFLLFFFSFFCFLTCISIRTIEQYIYNKTYGPVHKISNNVVCATSKASDQPAHSRSLIRAFASRLSIL